MSTIQRNVIFATTKQATVVIWKRTWQNIQNQSLNAVTVIRCSRASCHWKAMRGNILVRGLLSAKSVARDSHAVAHSSPTRSMSTKSWHLAWNPFKRGLGENDSHVIVVESLFIYAQSWNNIGERKFIRSEKIGYVFTYKTKINTIIITALFLHQLSLLFLNRLTTPAMYPVSSPGLL